MSTEETSQGPNKGLLIAGGVIVGLAALYALYTFVVAPLLDGDDAGDPVSTQSDPTAPGADDASGQTPGGDTGTDTAGAGTGSEGPLGEGVDGADPLLEQDVVPETFEIFTARDPFQQLVVEAEAGTAVTTPTSGTAAGTTPGTIDGTTAGTTGGTTAGTTGGTTAGTTGGTTTGTTGGTTTGTTGGTTTGTTGGTTTGTTGGTTGTTDGTQGDGGGQSAPSTANVGSTTIRIDDVFTDDEGEPTLMVSVNGTVHTAGEGDVFAERFEVLDIDGVCATMLFGDSRFTLCEGESIVK